MAAEDVARVFDRFWRGDAARTAGMHAGMGLSICSPAAPDRCRSARRSVVASRAGDPDPDRAGLANLLRRASHLVVDLGDRIVRLEMPRVVVGGRGSRTVVVDAWCELA